MAYERPLSDFEKLELEFARRIVEEVNRKYSCSFRVKQTNTPGEYSVFGHLYRTEGRPKELWRSLEVYGSGFSHGRTFGPVVRASDVSTEQPLNPTD